MKSGGEAMFTKTLVVDSLLAGPKLANAVGYGCDGYVFWYTKFHWKFQD